MSSHEFNLLAKTLALVETVLIEPPCHKIVLDEEAQWEAAVEADRQLDEARLYPKEWPYK